jgi:8-oxo-dGTP pyrophosphatase MutT (NUDIX family)
MTIRQNVAAVIVHDGQILLSAFGDPAKPHYNFPGGGVEAGESIHDALRREVLEETGAVVTEIGRLLVVWEYEPRKHQMKFGDVHKVCLMFECTIAPSAGPLTPAQPDPHQVGAVWLPLNELHAAPIVGPLADSLIAVLNTPTAGAPFVTGF